MRQGQQNNNNKRMRGRNRKGPNPLTRSFESNGPDVKIRGTALHIAEKYGQLARDAQSSGDRVAAESYLQHAEHYYRIIAAAQAANPQQPQQVYRNDDDGEGDDDGMEHGYGGQQRNDQPPPIRPDQYIQRPPFVQSEPQPYVNGNGVSHEGPAPGTGEQPNFAGDGEEGNAPLEQNAGQGGQQDHGQRRRRRQHRGPRPEGDTSFPINADTPPSDD